MDSRSHVFQLLEWLLHHYFGYVMPLKFNKYTISCEIQILEKYRLVHYIYIMIFGIGMFLLIFTCMLQIWSLRRTSVPGLAAVRMVLYINLINLYRSCLLLFVYEGVLLHSVNIVSFINVLLVMRFIFI